MPSSNLEILAYDHTPLGPLCLRRRELLSSPGTVVTEVTLNHQFLMSSHNTTSERALASVALDMHPGTALSVLVGGLGLGYTAHAALASGRVAAVDVVELLPHVIDWLDGELFPLAAGLKADERFSVVRDDIYARLDRAPAARNDVVLIDVDHAPDDRLDQATVAFYTADGLRQASRHLAPGGVLGVWSYAASSPFSRALGEVFGDVRVEPVTYFNELIDGEVTDWLFFARARG
jgi:spermidine synthase